MTRERTQDLDERQDSEKEGQDAETVDEQADLADERRAGEADPPPDPAFGRPIPSPD